jgi:hypothetical protein
MTPEKSSGIEGEFEIFLKFQLQPNGQDSSDHCQHRLCGQPCIAEIKHSISLKLA